MSLPGAVDAGAPGQANYRRYQLKTFERKTEFGTGLDGKSSRRGANHLRLGRSLATLVFCFAKLGHSNAGAMASAAAGTASMRTHSFDVESERLSSAAFATRPV